MLTGSTQCRLGRGFVVLAPTPTGPLPFREIACDQSRHNRLLAAAQRLRGRVYLQDGAIQEEQLSADGRHVQPADDRSWHLLTVDRSERVTGCIRYLAHAPGASYGDLTVPEVLAQQPRDFAARAEKAIQSDLAKADRLGFSYVELGGWVIGEELRCSTEAIRMLLMMYSLSQLLGGAIALSTATKRHNSSGILRRTGGTLLRDGEGDVPCYFDSAYNCEMEMLRFDSRSPNPRYSGWIREFREALVNMEILTAPEATSTRDLLRLHSVLGESQRNPAAVGAGTPLAFANCP